MTTHVRRCVQIWNPNHRITCTRVDHEIKFVTVNTQFELRHFLKSITIVLNLRTRKCLLWGVCVYDSLPFLCSSVGRWIVSPPSASSSLSVGRGVLLLARKEGRRWGEDCHTLKWRIQRSIWFLFNFLSFLPVNPSHLFKCCCFFCFFFHFLLSSMLFNSSSLSRSFSLKSLIFSKMNDPLWGKAKSLDHIGRKCHTFPSVFCNHRVYNRTLWALKSLTSLVTHCYQFKMWTSPRFLVLFNGKTGKMPLRGRLHDSLFFSTAKQEKCHLIPCSFLGKTGKMPLNPCSFQRQNRKNALTWTSPRFLVLFNGKTGINALTVYDVSQPIPCSFQRQNRKNALTDSLFFSMAKQEKCLYRILVLFNGKTGKMPLRGRLHDSLFFSTAKQEKCLYRFLVLFYGKTGKMPLNLKWLTTGMGEININNPQ